MEESYRGDIIGQIKINYTAEQMKAMEYVAFAPKEWIQYRWDNRARRAIDKVVRIHSDKQPNKISLQEKMEIVRNAKIETARQRQERFERETRK